MTLWKVYLDGQPERFVVVSHPRYSPMSIKDRAVSENVGWPGWSDYTDLRVRKASEEEAKSLTGNESWILHCSVNDVNWKGALERLSLEEVNRLLARETRKTALQRLRGKKQRLEREA